MRISDWSSDVCSSDLLAEHALGGADQIVALVGLIRLRGRGRRGGIAGLLVGGGGRRRLLRIDVGVGIAGAVRGCLGARIDLGIGIGIGVALRIGKRRGRRVLRRGWGRGRSEIAVDRGKIGSASGRGGGGHYV